MFCLKDIQFKLRSYLKCLSDIIHERGTEGQIYCAPVLHWLEITNHGRNLAPHALGDVADINIPAIAAARVIRRYQACDDDELSLDVCYGYVILYRRSRGEAKRLCLPKYIVKVWIPKLNLLLKYNKICINII